MDPATAMVGLQVVSGVAKGMAGRAKGMSDAARQESEAQLAETQALQRDTIARDDLSAFLSSQRAARGANGLSATSPNALLLASEATLQGNRSREINRADDYQRAANYRTAAAASRDQGRMSLFTGVTQAGVSLAQGRIGGGI
ncbi:MAG: hypothetical protein ACPG4X_16480 [Pikeienuella sp.]